MKTTTLIFLMCALLVGCAGGGGEPEQVARKPAEPDIPLVTVETPEPLTVPEPVTLSSDTDWKGKAHNKQIEVIQVINVINPVAAYITEAFKQHGSKFSPTLHEEWTDTQAQLTKAMSLYDSCKQRMSGETFDKQLFLDLEEVWQLLVKTGVAGVRTKSMVDAELRKALR
jgi:hypothetical protein